MSTRPSQLSLCKKFFVFSDVLHVANNTISQPVPEVRIDRGPRKAFALRAPCPCQVSHQDLIGDLPILNDEPCNVIIPTCPSKRLKIFYDARIGVCCLGGELMTKYVRLRL